MVSGHLLSVKKGIKRGKNINYEVKGEKEVKEVSFFNFYF
jgi:hypothetical protein